MFPREKCVSGGKGRDTHTHTKKKERKVETISFHERFPLMTLEQARGRDTPAERMQRDEKLDDGFSFWPSVPEEYRGEEGPSTSSSSASLAEMLQRKSLSLSRCRSAREGKKKEKKKKKNGEGERTSRLQWNSRVIFTDAAADVDTTPHQPVKSAAGSRACQPSHILWPYSPVSRLPVRVTRCPARALPPKFLLIPPGSTSFSASQFVRVFVRCRYGTSAINGLHRVIAIFLD